jgi:uncharacterized alkaline shock family protein YloU
MNPEPNTSAPPAQAAIETAHRPVAGIIEIKPRVVFSLALEAALSTYGVVGIASRYTGFDATRRDPRRGLEVKCAQDSNGVTHVNVSVHITVEYGVRINAVISSLQHQIIYGIEHSTGYKVDGVNVHVAGLRVTHED